MLNSDTYISIKDVKKIVPLATATIYKLMAEDKFPKCMKIGYKSFWSFNLLTDWLNTQMADAQIHSKVRPKKSTKPKTV
jgi:predicted DNA-binding transcriptional regulator AlpA